MNKSAFLELIQRASTISDQQTEELEKVAATFPYCQTAHLLLAKSAHDKGSMLSTQRLRRASAYATNRQVLKRIIYTSPAPAPVFEETVTGEPKFIAPEAPAATTESLPVAHQEDIAIAPLEEEVTHQQPVEGKLPETEAAIPAPCEAVAETIVAESPEQAEAVSEEGLEEIEEEPSTAAGVADKIQETEEVMQFELAQLLTINSLSSTFTDLLAQKTDTDKPEAAASAHVALPQVIYPKNPAEANEALSQLIEEESTLAVHHAYVLEDFFPAAEEADVPEEEKEETFSKDSATAPSAVLPEDAEIHYAFSEIDRMYAEDALGYWMSSSRMGESLQLKNEVTRQRPVAFHPELILEYAKTHELQEQPQEQQAMPLHHQLNIIDQFLKLNPRLMGMQHIKLKQEPQEDLSLRNSKIKKGIASESLANIFLNQGKVKKAIKIYEQLVLKYPEKKSYFAEQIEKLQNIS